MMQIGFIGLGAMGRAMASNLAGAGHDVSAWNRSGGAVEGVRMAADPRDVFDAEVVFTMLSDDDAIHEVVLAPDLLRAARPGLVHVVSSTISVALAHELVRAHADADVGYVSAPVLGRPDVAARGELNVLLGGDPAAKTKARPPIEIVGGRVWDLGEAAPAANAAKIACNMMITMAIEAMAEAVVLTEANGLPRDRFFELILGTLFGSRSYRVYSDIVQRGDYTPGFKATLGLKDLRLASEAAAETGKALPMLAAVHARMGETVNHGWGDLDWSAMARYTLEGA